MLNDIEADVLCVSEVNFDRSGSVRERNWYRNNKGGATFAPAIVPRTFNTKVRNISLSVLVAKGRPLVEFDAEYPRGALDSGWIAAALVRTAPFATAVI